MRKMLLITLMLLVASTSMARDITPLTTDLAAPEASRYEGDCVVGNDDLDNLLGYYDTWFAGMESYAIPFNASEEGCACGEGVAVRSIHALVALDEFANLDVAVAVLEAVDNGSGCLVPGAELAVSDPVNVSGVTELSYIDIEVAIDGPCATAGDALFLAVYFLNDNDGQFFGLPITGPTPTLCYNYNDWGAGYTDVVDAYGFAGNLVIWADVDCCGEPVATEPTSLDSIKSLYR